MTVSSTTHLRWLFGLGFLNYQSLQAIVSEMHSYFSFALFPFIQLLFIRVQCLLSMEELIEGENH